VIQVIAQPMDLGTIKRRLEKGHFYAHPDLVQPDISLVFANAMQYNPAGSDVHVMASTLQELCMSKWQAMVAPRLVEVRVVCVVHDQAHMRALCQNMESSALQMDTRTSTQKGSGSFEKRELESQLFHVGLCSFACSQTMHVG